MRESDMDLCIIGKCGSKSGRDSIHFYSVPSIITNQGEEFEELTRERRNLWISAIYRADLKTNFKNVLKNEHVCSRHFVSGRLPWMPEVFLSLSDKILRSGERNLSYRPLSSLRTPVQWDAVSYSQSQILTLAIRLVPGTCQF